MRPERDWVSATQVVTRLYADHGGLDLLNSLTSGAPPGRSRAISAALIGNLFEWYDFTSYGLFGLPIAKAFFPNYGPFTSILLALGTFGVGFIMRPVGAIVLGQYSDRRGRKAALTLIITLMTIGTALIVFVPTYAQIGPLAPALILVARLLQGFSVGGDLGSATAFIMESAPRRLRGRYAGWQAASQYGGSLIGATMAALVSNLLTETQVVEWGWRIPFIFGLVLGPVGYYIRAHATEPVEFLKDRSSHDDPPLEELWNHHRPDVGRVFGVTILYTIATYTLILYMPTYAAQYLDVPLSSAMVATALAQAVLVIVCPCAGQWSDRVGRKTMIGAASGALFLASYPFFALLVHYPTGVMLAAGQALMAVLLGLLAGPSVAYMGDLFPARVRSSGLSLGYNLAVPIFGGFGAFIITGLIIATGIRVAPAFYIMFGAILTLGTIILASRGVPNHVAMGGVATSAGSSPASSGESPHFSGPS
jgi:MHS family proline/betaine transporter-like MFS transporter